MSFEITQEIADTLMEAIKREEEFWERHGIKHESEGRLTGRVSNAHRSWVKAVEYEYKIMGKEVRVHLDTPLARKAFILGFNMACKQYFEALHPSGSESRELMEKKNG